MAGGGGVPNSGAPPPADARGPIRAGGPTAKTDRDAAPGRPRGPRAPGVPFCLKFLKKQTPEYASGWHRWSRKCGEPTSSHLALEAGPWGVSHFKFENQLGAGWSADFSLLRDTGGDTGEHRAFLLQLPLCLRGRGRGWAQGRGPRGGSTPPGAGSGRAAGRRRVRHAELRAAGPRAPLRHPPRRHARVFAKAGRKRPLRLRFR